MLKGSMTPKIIIISRTELDEKKHEILVNNLNRAGIPESDYLIVEKESSGECKNLINTLKPNVIVPLGEDMLNYITGLEKIQNHKCTVLKAKAEFGGIKTIPLLHPEHIVKVWEDHAYLSFGCHRLKQEYHSKEIKPDNRCFRLSLDLSFEEMMKQLRSAASCFEVSIDFETGRSQVNTFGIAVSGQEALAIEVIPSKYTPEQFHRLWSLINEILQDSAIKKIMQNGMHESQFASLYGIEIKGISFDTMVAFKMLHPSLEMGLDNICRLYTDLPYWKDEGKDWNDVRNWRDHLIYNCKDTTATFQAKTNLEIALKERGLWEQYETYMATIYPSMQSMSNEGINLSVEKLEAVKAETEKEFADLNNSFNVEAKERFGKEVNVNSHKQVKSLFREIGIKIPTKMGKETVSKDALKKLTKSYPNETLIKSLIKLSDLNSELETYCNFKYDEDGRMRFSASMFHNEYGEFKTSANAFDKGFSMDGLYKKTKSFFIADEGKEFLEISFYKPELTYLAYDSGDSKMISMIEQNQDIPSILATRMFNKAFPNQFSHEYRIAEAAIYAAAYGQSPRAFAIQTSATIKGISDNDAKKYISIIFEFFPKLKKRQENISYKLRKDRTLVNLLGSKITYYDRFNDDLFKKAYEWGYRSLMADLIKQISIHLVSIKAITNESVLVEAGFENIWNTVDLASSRLWHPELKTHSHSFKFQPVCKKGTSWGNLETV